MFPNDPEGGVPAPGASDPPSEAPAELGEPAAVGAAPVGAAPVGPGSAPWPASPIRSSRPVRSTPLFGATLALVAILAGGALFVSGYSLGQRTALQPGTAAQGPVSFDAFWDAYQAIDGRYAGGPLNRKALVEGAIKGMFEAIGDPYSAYLNSEEYRLSLQGLAGQFEGIGVEVRTRAADGTEGCGTLGDDCRLTITRVFEGSPAEKVGLQIEDMIVAVDGVTLNGLTSDDARDRIRGPKGSEVVLRIERPGSAAFDQPIVRDIVTTPEVASQTYAGGAVGYVRLTGFSDNGAAEFVKVVKAFVDQGIKKLIVDVRGNPGGYTTAVRTVTSQFIGSGPLFWEVDGSGAKVERSADAGGVATDPSIQLVVLIDGGSASASEILAGAIRDTGRGTLVGQKTFGKGTVQQWTVLDGDYGGFRLTIARWLTPNQRWIHKAGIEPDITVTVPDDNPAGVDPSVNRALEVLGEAGSTASLLRPAA